MRLLIRCDASPQLGAGHAMRCMALAERAEAAVFMMRSGHELVASRGFSTIAIDIGANQTQPAANAWRPDWIVVDIDAAEGFVVEASPIAPVLRLDDGGFAHPTAAKLVLNPNVGIVNADYPRVEPRRLLLGPGYALLRRTFNEQLPHSGAPSANGQPCIFVGFGGSDPPNMTTRAIRALSALGGCRLQVVLGAGNPHRASVEAAAAGDTNIEIHVDPPDLAVLMARSDIAVTAASGMLWEVMSLGVPVLAIAIAENQRRNLEWLGANGGGALGWHEDVTGASLVTSVRNALRDHEWCWAAAESGRKLVDGRGVERVLARMASVKEVERIG